MKRCIPFAVAVLASAAPAAAFDCAKAAGEIEQAICADQDALAANERMEAAYFAARDRLDEAGRKQLLESQRNWIRYRDDSCGAEPVCLAEASGRHADLLKAVPEGTVPFVVYQKGNPHNYDVLIEGSHFTEPLDPGERAYEAWLTARIGETPLGQADDDEEEHDPYSHELTVELPLVSDRLISAVAYSYAYSGGAHPNGWSTSINIDRQTGEALGAGQLFGPGALTTLTGDCQRQIVEWYADSYEGMDQTQAITQLEQDFPGVVAEHVGNMSRWHFEASEAVIRFDSYAAAPYAAGPAECRFDNADLRALATRPEVLPAE